MRKSLVVVVVAVLAALIVPIAQPSLFAFQQAAPATEERAAERQALGFLGYLDHGRFADSYAYTGMLIRAQVDRASFASQVEKARQGTGAMLTRELMDASYETSVPGAPDGQYVVLHYHSSFADRQEAVETLTLAFAKGYWRVSGYYIK
jgi:hypothetical protein